MEVGIELLLPGGEPVQQLGGELGALPGDGAAVAPQRKIGHVFRRELDDIRKRLVPVTVVIGWVPPGVVAYRRSLFHLAPAVSAPVVCGWVSGWRGPCSGRSPCSGRESPPECPTF